MIGPAECGLFPSTPLAATLRNPPNLCSNAVTGASERCRRVDRALSELKTLGRHSGDVWAVAITPDGLKAISASSDQTLKLWDLTSAIALNTFTGHLPRKGGLSLDRWTTR